MLIYYILLGLFSFATIIQLYYFIKYYSKISFTKLPKSTNTVHLPISIIIAARNESENLTKYLNSILQQDYSNFEVIVVNDCSYDQSSDVLKGFKVRYEHLKIVEIEEDDRFKHGKKFALTLGIKAAKYEHLLFTDADCEPVSNKWLFHMQSYFEKNEIVIGHSPYIKGKGILNAIARFETFQTAFNYFSFALAGQPYMGVGRNLAYTKTLFFKHKGFASHMHLLSGDDDLFVNQASTAANTAVCLEPESFVMTESKKSWGDYFIQKLRHHSVGSEYKMTHRFSLTLLSLSGTFFYAFGIALLCLGIHIELILSIALLRFLLVGLYYYKSMKRLAIFDLYWASLLLDFIYFISIPLWSIFLIFTKKRRWK